jgi:hypothetical protein
VATRVAGERQHRVEGGCTHSAIQGSNQHEAERRDEDAVPGRLAKRKELLTKGQRREGSNDTKKG